MFSFSQNRDIAIKYFPHLLSSIQLKNTRKTSSFDTVFKYTLTFFNENVKEEAKKRSKLKYEEKNCVWGNKWHKLCSPGEVMLFVRQVRNLCVSDIDAFNHCKNSRKLVFVMFGNKFKLSRESKLNRVLTLHTKNQIPTHLHK